MGESLDIFSERIETGAHRASIVAVAEGRADVCAIDCRSWHMAKRHEPKAKELRVVGWTGLRKGLPMITSVHTPEEISEKLIEILSPPEVNPKQARIERIARQLLVAALGDQDLLFDLDALVPAEPADIAFHAQHHARLQHAVRRVVGPVGGVRQRRVFVGQADAVIEHAVARRKAIRRRVLASARQARGRRRPGCISAVLWAICSAAIWKRSRCSSVGLPSPHSQVRDRSAQKP